MTELRNFIESISGDSALRDALIMGYETIFEANFHNPTTVVNSAKAMGDYSNIMKQVNVGVVPGNGMGIDKRPNQHVSNTAASMRDPVAETQNEWDELKTGKPPIKPNAPAFVGKAIEMAQAHLPMPMTGSIPSSQRRFGMIYPTLNTGINTSAPKLGV